MASRPASAIESGSAISASAGIEEAAAVAATALPNE